MVVKMPKLQIKPKKGKPRQAVLTIPLALVESLGWKHQQEITIKLASELTLEEADARKIKLCLVAK